MAEETNILKTEWFWAMMQFFIVAVTLVLIYVQVKIQTAAHLAQTKAHEAQTAAYTNQTAAQIVQTLSTINNRWNSESMMRARHKVCSDWINDKHDFDGVDEYVAEFMEELGLYLEIKAVPDKTMWSAHSWYIEHYYCMFKEGIFNMREEHKEETLYRNFENLYVAMHTVGVEMKVPDFERRKAALDVFANTELVLTKAFLQLPRNTSF